jgi:hypothetical protein
MLYFYGHVIAMRSVLLKFGLAISVLALQLTVQAIPYVNGSLSFNGVPVFNNPANLSAATAFTAINSVTVAAGQQQGDYIAIPDGQSASFSAFVFSPPTSSLPLWSLDYNGITYSFQATSMVAHYNPTLQIWNMGGTGIASITGEQDSPGAWNLSAGKQGVSFFLGSAAGAQASVPEVGTTVLLLGVALAGLGVLCRKLR